MESSRETKLSWGIAAAGLLGLLLLVDSASRPPAGSSSASVGSISDVSGLVNVVSGSFYSGGVLSIAPNPGCGCHN